MLVPSLNPILNPKPSVAGVERELRALPHLKGGRSLVVKGMLRIRRDARRAKTAVEAIGKLPAPDEALHLVISGRFALWHFVPATYALSGGQTIEELRIATL